jgi:hypothetical protein
MRPADYDQAVEAVRRWIAEHGRYPQQQEWEHRAPGRSITRVKRQLVSPASDTRIPHSWR